MRAVGFGFILFLCACSSKVANPPPSPTDDELPTDEANLTKPNVVFILADDFAWNLVQYMPNLEAMQRDGATFSRVTS